MSLQQPFKLSETITLPKSAEMLHVLFTMVTLQHAWCLDTHLLVIKQTNNTNEAIRFQRIIAARLYQSLSTQRSQYTATRNLH